MIGDTVYVDGTPFRIEHFRCRNGLVHAVVALGHDRYHVPQHRGDGLLRDADPTEDPVLTCLTCVGYEFVSTPLRYDEYGGDDDEDD